MSISFVIPGIKGKARARVTRTGHAYTPSDTVNYENLVKLLAMKENKERLYFDKEPLRIKLRVFYDVPESYSKKKREQALQGELRPTKKPDADNIVKIVCDALNKVIYKDDSQIVEVFVKKEYTAKEPHVFVTISQI